MYSIYNFQNERMLLSAVTGMPPSRELGRLPRRPLKTVWYGRREIRAAEGRKRSNEGEKLIWDLI